MASRCMHVGLDVEVCIGTLGWQLEGPRNIGAIKESRLRSHHEIR